MIASAPTSKVGSTVYLKLDSFEPEWRQALIVTVRKEQLVLAVRVVDSELEDKWESVSFFEIRGMKFIMVEGERKQMRAICPFPHRALELDAKLVLPRALETAENEKALYATVSEDLPEAGEPSSRRKGLQSLLRDSGSEDSEEDGESEVENSLLKMLGKAQKAMPGLGTASGNPGGKPEAIPPRFPLLGAQPKKVEEKSVVDQLLSRVMTDPSQSMDASTLATLVQMELLRELKGKKKKSTHSYGSTELVASSDSDSSSGGDIRLRGAGKALKAYRKTQKDMKKNPARHVKRYIKEVEQVLGADASVPYLLTDYTRMLGWGKFRTLQRLHHALSTILETQLKGKTMEATLQITQVLRSIHQCALDQGNWQTAWLLTGMQDPLEKPRFGGEAQSLEVIAAYIKAMDDLEKRSTSSSASRSQEEDAPAGAKGNKKGKKGQKADAEPVG